MFAVLRGRPLVTMSKSFYAVAKGRKVGIFTTWNECKAAVEGFHGPKYRKFSSRDEAQTFIDEFGGSESPAKRVKKSTECSKKVDMRRELQALKSQNEAMKVNLKAYVHDQEVQLDAMNSRIDVLINALDRTPENEEAPPGKRPRTDDICEAVAVKSDGLHVDEKGYVHVYTDGSCENNGKSGARGGYGVWWADGHSLNRGEAASRATNNAAEIEAVTEAVRIARSQNISKLKVLTDSKFVIQCVTEWMQNWKRNGWMTSKNEAVKNRAELEELDQALNASPDVDVVFEHVRGHVGIRGNEAADALARMGAEKFGRKHLFSDDGV